MRMQAFIAGLAALAVTGGARLPPNSRPSTFRIGNGTEPH